MFLVVSVCPHRVQGGLHPPLAEGELGLVLSPPQDAWRAEAVKAWHGKAGLIPAAQPDGTAVLQLRGHALHWLRWSGDAEQLPLTGAAAAGVKLEKAEATVIGQ